MPSATVQGHGVPAVVACASFLHDALDRAEQIKGTPSIEPPLTKSELGDVSAQVTSLFDDALGAPEEGQADQRKLRQYAIFETAARDLFSELIATTPIESPEFVKVWNFLDLLSILSDDDRCDPALLFWLVEELLDSQTISGCRRIFDFLESRRERITAKYFKQKQLVILRSCNELLRRLSRAEDTTFCGRVFIFMFQSFPLGDKSSVNLRGEYHVENVTTFDDPQEKEGEAAPPEGAMEVDSTPNGTKEAAEPKNAPTSKPGSFNSKQMPNGKPPPPLDTDEFYPVFWSLQDSFSQPKKLFDAAHFSLFRGAMEATMTVFRSTQVEHGPRSAKSTTEDAGRSLKRKRDEGEDDLANAFNPKYLTSRDLFELEISDLSFRRHILVQALIIMDFLLSLSAKAKEKLATARGHNKSVTYMDQRLSDDDVKWATEMKRSIADYLRQGVEGPFFYRMVDSVLARDKNWVRWKVESCPNIALEPISADLFVEAKNAVQRGATNKRLRPSPMGSLNLEFLARAVKEKGEGEGEGEGDDEGLERLKVAERYAQPELETFRRMIADDDFEIEMPTNNDTKAAAVDGKASKSWRALRIAGRHRLAAFDRIDDPDKIDAIFEEEPEEVDEEDDEPLAKPEDMPKDVRLLVVSGTRGAGKTTLVDALVEKRPGVFKRVVRHTTREHSEGEAAGKDFHFVTSEAFNVMVNNDQLLEFTKVDGAEYGTSRKAVEAISNAGRVPVLEVPRESVQQIADMAFPHRAVLIQTPSPETLETRLKASEKYPEAAVREMVEQASSAMPVDAAEEAFGLVVVNEDVPTATETLRKFVYGEEEAQKKERSGEEQAPAEKKDGPAESDSEMKDSQIEEAKKGDAEVGATSMAEETNGTGKEGEEGE